MGLPPRPVEQPQTSTPAANAGRPSTASGYEQAAKQRTGTEQARLQLLAAQEWLNANRVAEAQRVLVGISIVLTPEQQIERHLIESEITLALGQPQQAWTQVASISEPTGTPTAPMYFAVRERIALGAGRPVDAIRAETAGERLTTDPAERSRQRQGLLAGLRQLKDRGVRLDTQQTSDPMIRGWLDLAALSGTGHGAAIGGTADASHWRATYPDHPATELTREAFSAEIPLTGAVHQIALLLPLTGPNSGAALRVQEGFQYAYNQLNAGERPALKVYDTNMLSVPDALAQARSDGAQVIVGPLTRDEVNAAADAGSGVSALLALNTLTGNRAVRPGFYQFALSPEDEARQVARRLLASGLRRGASLVAAGKDWSEWGARVQAAFNQELQSGGGELLTQTRFDPEEHDFGAPIHATLGTDQSEARRDRLERVLGTKLQLEPRRRADLQFIFVAGPAVAVRLLRPQLSFQNAGDVPIFSTSDAYSAEAGEANQDLEGIQFPDLPWLVPDGGHLDELHRQVEQSEGGATTSRSRLFAFGYDACQLALAITAAGRDRSHVAIDGLTGQLSIDAEGYIRREGVWVQLHNGTALLSGAPVPPAAP
ncbi:MAG: penicillin-binding protein activator [Steroidobacteraceae bacterium]